MNGEQKKRNVLLKVFIITLITFIVIMPGVILTGSYRSPHPLFSAGIATILPEMC